MSFFELQHKDTDSHARTGIIQTDHGDVLTPIFMPVGTQASVKTLDSTDVENIGAQIILGNNYHLHLRPGADLIASVGGLHKFMNWPKPILTDSGGFQVFSLGLQKKASLRGAPQGDACPLCRAERDGRVAISTSFEDSEITASPGNRRALRDDAKSSQARLVSIDEAGVTFTSHIDGSTHRFTPETAIETQHKLGADIIMAFDECTPDDASREYTAAAMERTHRWAARSLATHQKNINYHGYKQFLFGIIQGSVYEDLRQESARFISAQDFDGIAIGGESIGYNMSATARILDWVYPLIPENKPHYAMGVGLNPTDLLVAVEHGVDMFDCVAPTRLARHGMLFTFNKKLNHRINIKNAQFEKDATAVDAWCDCSTCKNYSRSYLHHLFSADEITGLRLASIHNLRFLLKLMEETRVAIEQNRFIELRNRWI